MSDVKRITATVSGRIRPACAIQAVAAIMATGPYIAIAELGIMLMRGGPLDAARTWWIVALGALALLLRLCCLLLASGLTHLADNDLQLHLRQSLAKHLSRVPLGWFDDTHSGHVKKVMQDDVLAIHYLVGHAYTDRISAIVTPAAALAYLGWIEWRLVPIILLPVILTMIIYWVQFRGIGQMMSRYNKALAGVNAAAVELVQGISVVKTFGLKNRSFQRFTNASNEFADGFWEMVRGQLSSKAAADLLLSPITSIVLVLVAGLTLAANQKVAVSDILPFIVLAPALSSPFLVLTHTQSEFVQANRAARRLLDVLDLPVLPQEKNQTPRLDEPRIQFEDVSFSYDERTEAIRNINLTLHPRTVTALVGASGAGKSTLAHLLPRFWDPTEGRITLNGVDLRHIDRDHLYRAIGFVFQETQLLHATVRENIVLGRTGASEQQIIQAAQQAQIHDRISALAGGYNTMVGSEGVFSGGEAQRIALARALLADTPVVVLDEATAFADPDCAAEVQTALSTLVEKRTVLVIAHRLHTVMQADQICVMSGGQIVETGRHEDLVARKGIYAELWAALRASEQHPELVLE